MKSLACIFALTMLLMAAPSVPTAAAASMTTQPAGQTIADSKGDFTIVIPPTWKQGKLKAGREGVLVMGPPPRGTRAYPMFQAQRGLRPGDASKPLDESVNAIVEQFTKRPASETTVSKVRLDGVEARLFSVTLDADEKPVVFDYVIAVNKGQLFSLNFMQEQAHYDAEAAKGVFDSFRWSK